MVLASKAIAYLLVIQFRSRKVGIDIIVDGNALLPIPIDEDNLTIGGGICTYMLWPINLIVVDSKP
ncbi:hypothetical protein Lal_00014085 [Lupinus albus]|nr:hypothetical protein Lal_00014085 [Lupinus albus]